MLDLTVIIPCYHVPRSTLARCLRSILPLTSVCQWEGIVVDDGNERDEIRQWVEQDMHDDHFTVLRQENRGLGGARNTGIEAAQGRYLIFLDADDELIADAFIPVLRQTQLDVYDFVSYRYQPSRNPQFDGEACEYMAQYDIVPASPCYAIRRSTLGQLRFSERLLHEDEEFTTLLYLQSHRVLVTDALAYRYHVTSQSIIHNDSPSHLSRRFSDLLHIMGRFSNLDVQGVQRQALIRRQHVLAMCILVTLMRDAHSRQLFTQVLQGLRQLGFYPLPHHAGIRRYGMVRLATYYPWMVRLFAPVVSLLIR